MRVCLVADTFYPAYSGLGIRFQRYIPGLEARGVGVEVFCGTPTAVRAEMAEVPATWRRYAKGHLLPLELVNGVRVQRVRLPDHACRRRRLLLGRSLLGLLRTTERAPDVVQLLSMSLESIPSLLALRRIGVPTVFTGSIVSQLPTHPLKRMLARRYRAVPLRLVDAVIASSAAMRDQFMDLGLFQHVQVIPHGVNLERFRPARHAQERCAIRRMLGIGHKDPFLLYVGVVNPRKRIDLLLEAWVRLASQYPAAHLVLVGPRPDHVDPARAGFAQRVYDLCVASGAADRVHFTGIVQNVDDYMRAADIFILPSEREGMPNVVLEAMASGLPVVMTPFVGLSQELGQAGREYLLAREDGDAVAASVARLLDNATLRHQMSRASRRWVEMHMDVNSTLDRYAAMYRSMAGIVAGDIAPAIRA